MIGAEAVLFLVLATPQGAGAEEAGIRRLVEALGADFLQDREQARRELEKRGPAAAPFLIAALGHADFRVRRSCIEILSALKEERAVDPVGEVFRTDEDPLVRDAAFSFLKAAGRAAARHLIGALESGKAEYRREAAKVLAELRCPEAAGVMSALFESDPDREVRDQAFEYLKTAGRPAEPHLIRLLGHADPAVRRGALAGLRAVREERKEIGAAVLEAVGRAFVVETDGAALREAYDHLRAAGPRAEGVFLEGLRSRGEAVRGLSLEGLREIGGDRAIGPAAELFLKDDSEEVRLRACEYLKAQGTKAEKAFLEALDVGNPQVRVMAIPALGQIGSLRPLERIGALFRQDRDPAVRRAAFEYLVGIGAAAEPHLLQALSEGDRRFRLEAIQALGRIRSAAAVESLVGFLERLDPECRKAAGEALVRIGGPAAGAVRRAAASGRIRESAAAELLALMDQVEVERVLDGLVTGEGSSGWFPGMFRGLEPLGRQTVVPILLKMATDRGYRWRLVGDREPGRAADRARTMQGLAVMALGEWGDASAVAPLKELLEETSRRSGEEHYGEIVVALHRLGEEGPYREFRERATAEAEEAFDQGRIAEGCEALFQLGLVQGRVGREEEAEGTYRRLLRKAEEGDSASAGKDCVSSACYNLACLAARRGRTSEALQWLRKAVEAGFRDREWILLDRELDPLREEEGFRKLLEDRKRFERE